MEKKIEKGKGKGKGKGGMIPFSSLKVGMKLRVEEAIPPRYHYPEHCPKPGQVGVITEAQRGCASEVLSKIQVDGKIFYIGPRSTFSTLSLEEEEKLSREIKEFNSLKPFIIPYEYIGSDPEVFVVDEKGVVIPAFTFLPDSTEKKNGVAFWDGFQAEFTTSPSTCLASHVDCIWQGLKTVIDAAREVNPKARLTHKTVLDIPLEIMESVEDKHAELGCAPSFNAYKDSPKLRIRDGRKLPFRFAGGHLHLGIGPTDEPLTHSIVKAMDSILGVASVSLLEGLEDPRRRQFYGMVGEYRTPAHGLEYRVLSSAILAHPALVHLCFDLGRAVSTAVIDGKSSFWEAEEEEVRDVVNNYDFEGARKIISRNKKSYLSMMEMVYKKGTTKASNPMKLAERGLRLILEGAQNLLPIGDGIEKLWFLDEPKGRYTGPLQEGEGREGEWTPHSETKNTCLLHLTFKDGSK